MKSAVNSLKKPFEYTAVGITSIIFLVVHLRLYDEIWGAPFTKGGDADFHYIMVKTIQKTGWIFENDQLGYPKTSRIHDVPQGGDNLHWFAMKIISYFTSAVQTVNIYFVLSFALVSMAAYGASRWYGSSKIASYVISILYAFMPYHFYRGENHLLLSMYFVIPLAVVYAYKSCSSDEKLKKPLLILFAALVASTGAYYLIFTILLILFALLFNIVNKNYKRIRQQLLFMSIAIFVFLFNLLPSIIFVLKNGSNSKAASRSVADAEFFGLQITDIFSPRTDHRVPVLRDIGNNIYNTGISSEAGQSIGIIASLGIIYLIINGVRAVISNKAITEQCKYFFVLVPTILLFAVSSGPTLVVGYLGFTQIRSWNRVVVIIAFIGLLCAGYFIDKLNEKMKTKNMTIAYYLLIIFVLFLGFLDLTSNADRFSSRANSVAIKNDCTFIKSIEDAEPKNLTVFQFPYVEYPEGQDIVNLKHNDQAMGILCDTKLKFSFGAMLGRDDKFQKSISKDEDITFQDILKLKEQKFSVIEVDRDAYEDRGLAIEKKLVDEFGDPILSADQSKAAYIID